MFVLRSRVLEYRQVRVLHRGYNKWSPQIQPIIVSVLAKRFLRKKKVSTPSSALTSCLFVLTVLCRASKVPAGYATFRFLQTHKVETTTAVRSRSFKVEKQT